MAEAAAAGAPEFGPYRVLELIGQGGMGMVHRAYDTLHDREIALKRLAVTDEEFRARFRRESRIAANLRHPNVVPVHDFGEIDGQLFLDMMLVDGVDLRRAVGTGVVDLDQIRLLRTDRHRNHFLPFRSVEMSTGAQNATGRRPA